jgi:uncharacterized membrane protein
MATDIRRSATVNRDRSEVYAFWRKFENLPRFMPDLVSVEERGDGTSHWVAKGPAGKQVEWDATTTADEPNQRIAWQSAPDAEVRNSGEVLFRDAPAGRGTEVTVALQYDPPLGAVGRTVAKLFGEEPDQQVRNTLRALKQVLEAGEIPTTDGQPSGRVPEEERRIAEQIRTRFTEQFRSEKRDEETAS